MSENLLPLPDGWHPIPGDGLLGDPDRRENAVHTKACGERYYHWVHIQDRQIDALYADARNPGGWKTQGPVKSNHRKYLISAQANWGIFLYDLVLQTLPESDDWENEFEFNT